MKKENKREFLSYIIIIVVVLLIRTFIATPVRVNGTSMVDTLEDRDIMILNKIKYRISDIKRFDIIVIQNDKEKLIKRVIGLPGETVEWKDNVLYINDEAIEEDYLDVTTKDFEKVTIEEGCYFAVGDNRGVSLDSRYYGCFDEKNILGTARVVIYPLNRIGTKK